MKTQSKIAILPSCKVHYLESGKVNNPAIILLHGMKFQAATWEKLGTLQKLSNAGFHVIGLDLPGFGESPVAEVTPNTVLSELIEKLGLSSPALIGPSMGGKISLEFALDHPGILGSLVLVGSVGVADNQERLSSLNLPLLIVWGSNDQIAPPAHADFLHKAVAGSRKVIIDSAPHPCYLEAPEKWHDTLLDFLATP